jgi:hypothetical protein
VPFQGRNRWYGLKAGARGEKKALQCGVFCSSPGASSLAPAFDTICFAYALAKQHCAPVLYVGNDFALTDIESALKISKRSRR